MKHLNIETNVKYKRNTFKFKTTKCRPHQHHYRKQENVHS